MWFKTAAPVSLCKPSWPPLWMGATCPNYGNNSEIHQVVQNIYIDSMFNVTTFPDMCGIFETKYDCFWYLSLPIHFQRCRIENGFSWLCCKKFAVFGCLTVKLGRPGRGGLGGQPERERELLKYSSLVAPCSLFWPSLLDYKDNTTSIQSSFNSWQVQSQWSHYSWIQPLILL